ncbi:hypothetical protein CPB84DRAFT_1699444 [Gymnopilus junonius]|uniref:BRCT domain-containing protein n=1 Tax=Gymnopilus junonius TaxID=109634 RepID=A0A9P5TV55_GYMJU|nr:hypothetical protein CPB84DRAFT_1699444 [Gymnopilus junonius]
MEAYFPVVAKGSLNGRGKPHSSPDQGSFKELSITPLAVSIEGTSNITKGLLTTLSDTSNPITHSDIYERTDHIVSFSTGHQVSEGRRSRTIHFEDRASKLHSQQGDLSINSAGILKNTKIYVDGYLESTTDLEVKGLVLQTGGKIVRSASQCTHIITSRCLSASKTERLLTKRTSRHLHVVKPEWVLDSIAAGKRMPEQSYTIIQPSNAMKLCC